MTLANLYNHLQHHHKIQYELAVKDKKTTSEIPAARQETLSLNPAFRYACWKPCMDITLYFLLIVCINFFV